MAEPIGLNRLGTVLVAAAFLLLLLAPASYAIESRSLSVTVYSNDYAYVDQVIAADSRASSVQVPLLSAVVSNLVATDQNGSPLSYEVSGTNITIYTLGASLVTLRYDTASLTAKNGSVWTLAFTSEFNSTVILPLNSTLLWVSGTPYSINETSPSPELDVPPGTWKVSYGVHLGSTTTGPGTTGTTGTTGTGPPGGPGSTGATLAQSEEVAGAVAAVAAGGAYVLWWRRRRAGRLGGDLRPDDVRVLSFIQERGGKVMELEIRTRFALPKTSAWRQIKRLERMGYVRVTKMGSQNQIEALKDGGARA